MSTPSTRLLSQNLKPLIAALEQFLFGNDKKPVVVAIKGGWGEGKTHFWKRDIAARCDRNQPGYVSVFGAESLSSIQRQVVAEAFRTSKLTPATLKTRLKSTYPFLIGSGKAFNDWLMKRYDAPDLMPLAPVLLEKLALREGWVVCLDDIERLPKGVELEGLFGYANSLREERGVSVVLIYNDDKFDDEPQRQTFLRYAEKVIDREYVFTPDAKDLVRFVFGDDFESKPFLSSIPQKCEFLDLRNIRILKHVKRYFDEVVAALPQPVDDDYATNLLHSILLFCWSKYAKADSKNLDFDFLNRFDGTWDSVGDLLDEEEAKGEPDWRRKVLRDYPYVQTDEFDRLLMRFLSNNLLEPEIKELRAHYAAHVEAQKTARAMRRFEAIWGSRFHNTLKDTSIEFVDELRAALNEDGRYLPVTHIDRALQVLVELGRKGDAGNIFSRMTIEIPEKLAHARETMQPLQFQPLKELGQELKRQRQADDRPFAEVVEEAVKDNMIHERERKRLAAFGVDDYVKYFESTERDGLVFMLNQLWQASRGGQDEFDRKIHSDVVAAAQTLATRNIVSPIRLAQILSKPVGGSTK